MSVFSMETRVKLIPHILATFIFLNIIFLVECDGTYNTSTQKKEDIKPSDPYSKEVGNGILTYYIFHNFIGEEPDIIPATANDDVENYLNNGVTIYALQVIK